MALIYKSTEKEDESIEDTGIEHVLSVEEFEGVKKIIASAKSMDDLEKIPLNAWESGHDTVFQIQKAICTSPLYQKILSIGKNIEDNTRNAIRAKF